MTAAGGTGGVQTGMGECFGDLLVQLLAVGNDDDTGITV